MHPISIITIVALGALYGLAWHNQPARIESSAVNDDAVPGKTDRADWVTFTLWSFVVVCFAAFVSWLYLLSRKCGGH